VARVSKNLLAKARELASAIVADPAYFQDVKRRAIAGELSPQMETMLWAYAYGKPIETIEVSEPDRDLEVLSNADLARMAQELHAELSARGTDATPVPSVDGVIH
jgi:hypothetical protein